VQVPIWRTSSRLNAGTPRRVSTPATAYLTPGLRLLYTPVLEMETYMTDTDDRQHRSILQRIAHRVMLERGLVPDFPLQALTELDEIHGPATRTEESTHNLRNLLWCSIDNDDSRDLDQLTVAGAMPD